MIELELSSFELDYENATVGMPVKCVKAGIRDSGDVLGWSGTIRDIHRGRAINTSTYNCVVTFDKLPDGTDAGGRTRYWSISFLALEGL